MLRCVCVCVCREGIGLQGLPQHFGHHVIGGEQGSSQPMGVVGSVLCLLIGDLAKYSLGKWKGHREVHCGKQKDLCSVSSTPPRCSRHSQIRVVVVCEICLFTNKQTKTKQ